jgi:hypothetical protein
MGVPCQPAELDDRLVSFGNQQSFHQGAHLDAIIAEARMMVNHALAG